MTGCTVTSRPGYWLWGGPAAGRVTCQPCRFENCKPISVEATKMVWSLVSLLTHVCPFLVLILTIFNAFLMLEKVLPSICLSPLLVSFSLLAFIQELLKSRH
jgi:hypothetical protein